MEYVELGVGIYELHGWSPRPRAESEGEKPKPSTSVPVTAFNQPVTPDDREGKGTTSKPE